MLTTIKNSFEMKFSLVFDSVVFEPFEKTSSVYAGKYRAAFRKVKHLPNLKVVNFLKLSFFL